MKSMIRSVGVVREKTMLLILLSDLFKYCVD